MSRANATATSATKQIARTGNNKIPWGYTDDRTWEKNQHQVTFHFSSDEYRSLFTSESSRLLSRYSWEMIDKKDDDPAKPSRR
jgi:hypothetical protein